MASHAATSAKFLLALAAVLAIFASTAVVVGAANPITAPIVDRGVTVEITPLVQLPDGTRPDRPRARLNQFATAGDRLFVLEDFDGLIYEIDREDTSATASLFFDVKSAIAAATPRELDLTSSFHGGLRGFAFHPDFASNGRFYTSVMETRPANPNPADYLGDPGGEIEADGVVIEWRYNHQAGAVDPLSYRQVFRVSMPVYEHPIKQMAFNPFANPGDGDYGLLYVSHGDGSVQSATAGGGQRNDALGKILRVDPLAANGQAYRVPADNPFVGDASMLDEVYALGFRNPHHLSFAEDDSGNAHLVAVDVGRDNVEEVNIVVSGGDYGWSDREGTFVHLPSGDLIDGIAPLPADDAKNGYVYPAAQFGHEGERGAGFVGHAIAGGFVVDNGSELSGQYFYSEFARTGQFFHSDFEEMLNATTTLKPGEAPGALTQAATGRVNILFDHDSNPNTPSQSRTSLLDVFDEAPLYDGSGRADVRIGQGPDGEMYLSSKKSGMVYLVTNSLPSTTTPPEPEPDPDPDPEPPVGEPPAQCEGREATIAGLIGTDGDDVIVGTTGPDVIDGRGGNDVICGRGGADTINGGSGADLINAGWGADVVRGGDGDDIILAGPGLDDVEGQNGDDLIRGGNGGDRLVGNGGNDTIYGGDRRDRIFGYSGNDALFGGGGTDNIRGGAGVDSATGGAGVDRCVDSETLKGCEQSSS